MQIEHDSKAIRLIISYGSNSAYLFRNPGQGWRLCTKDETSLGLSCISQDAMALRFMLDDCKTAGQAIAVVKKYAHYANSCCAFNGS